MVSMKIVLFLFQLLFVVSVDEEPLRELQNIRILINLNQLNYPLPYIIHTISCIAVYAMQCCNS